MLAMILASRVSAMAFGGRLLNAAGAVLGTRGYTIMFLGGDAIRRYVESQAR